MVGWWDTHAAALREKSPTLPSIGSLLAWKISQAESNGLERSQMRRTRAAPTLSKKAKERHFPNQQTTAAVVLRLELV